MQREMGRSGALHACRGDCQMAVDGLAGPSMSPKPSSPVPAGPDIAVPIPRPPPLGRRLLTVVTRAHTSIAVYVFEHSCTIYSHNEPFTKSNLCYLGNSVISGRRRRIYPTLSLIPPKAVSFPTPFPKQHC